jgi:hypothetical protein
MKNTFWKKHIERIRDEDIFDEKYYLKGKNKC